MKEPFLHLKMSKSCKKGYVQKTGIQCKKLAKQMTQLKKIQFKIFVIFLLKSVSVPFLLFWMTKKGPYQKGVQKSPPLTV